MNPFKTLILNPFRKLPLFVLSLVSLSHQIHLWLILQLHNHYGAVHEPLLCLFLHMIERPLKTHHQRHLRHGSCNLSLIIPCEALSHPKWRQTMIDETCALQSSGSWELVPLPPGKSLVGCRWLYIVKVGPNGKIDRFKARLVAKALAFPSA
ncbi:receptor-like protein kinase [Trifolium pratense]|uniref:Receptor-like protein kinase n=1 Tax=Trifolium pratense TaxID=57577 RepID=A0A2K3MJ45_TRIPR|nr:receptor-like protein kinase [Trifolium pratense]